MGADHDPSGQQASGGDPRFHGIDLGNGIVAPGAVRGMTHAPMGLDNDLCQTVLDIGAFDGYYSVQAERHGAKRVLATDWFVWNERWPMGSRGFQLSRQVLRSRVEDKTISVLDTTPPDSVWIDKHGRCGGCPDRERVVFHLKLTA